MIKKVEIKLKLKGFFDFIDTITPFITENIPTNKC